MELTTYRDSWAIFANTASHEYDVEVVEAGKQSTKEADSGRNHFHRQSSCQNLYQLWNNQSSN